MLYTLLKNERIVTGPRDWNPKYFEYFLQQECGVQTTLPEEPIVEKLIFNGIIKLVPTLQEDNPEINPLFEVLAGPNFKFDDSGNFVSYYIAQELSLDTAKNNLKQIISNNRWTKETTSINRNINEKQITIYTDRGSRTAYTQALILATDDYSALWKFPEGFFLLNKSDLQLVVDEVVAYVQTCFDWEANKTNEINSKTTIEELKQIILE